MSAPRLPFVADVSHRCGIAPDVPHTVAVCFTTPAPPAGGRHQFDGVRCDGAPIRVVVDDAGQIAKVVDP